MQLPLYWVDAFTRRAFAGNPAAVVPLTAWPDDSLLQRIAFENGLSETAFFVPQGAGRFQLRWFTPAVEVDLCGHATLATAHVLFRELGLAGDAVTFDSRSGQLGVSRRSDGRLELDFPARPATSTDMPAGLDTALGQAPREVANTPLTWLCIYDTADQVRALQPDHAALGAFRPGRFIVTAPGDQGCDFVSRFFAPDAGIAEDPVTGSAHCTLVPYWAARLGKRTLFARQVSARGGELWCELAPRASGGDRVKIAGEAVTYLRGFVDC